MGGETGKAALGVEGGGEAAAAGAARLPGPRVLVVDGRNDAGGGELDSAEIYYPDSDEWRPTAIPPFGGFVPKAVTLQDGSVLVAGGYDYYLGENLKDAALFIPGTE